MGEEPEPQDMTADGLALEKVRESVARLEGEAEIRGEILAGQQGRQPVSPKPPTREAQETRARAELEEIKRQLQAQEHPPGEPPKTM